MDSELALLTTGILGGMQAKKTLRITLLKMTLLENILKKNYIQPAFIKQKLKECQDV